MKKTKYIRLRGFNAEGNVKDFSLEDFRGQKIILYFYPKDNTPVCTQEACDFRDSMPFFSQYGVVIGVSTDEIESHADFREKHNLNFILLSDPEHELCEAFGVWQQKLMYGSKYMGVVRSTFILDENGNILKEWRKVKVKGHMDEVINFFNSPSLIPTGIYSSAP